MENGTAFIVIIVIIIVILLSLLGLPSVETMDHFHWRKAVCDSHTTLPNGGCVRLCANIASLILLLFLGVQ